MTPLILAFIMLVVALPRQQLLASRVPEDASAPPEIVSEIVPIQYAKAGDIAAVLNGRNGGGQAATNTRVMERLMNRPRAEYLDCGIQALGPRSITCDERSNSLWVLASPQDLNRIKGIIDELDIVEPQILIEAVVLELPLNNPKALRQAQPRVRRAGDASPGLSARFKLRLLSPTRFVAAETTNAPSRQGNEFSHVAIVNAGFDAAISVLMSNNCPKFSHSPRFP